MPRPKKPADQRQRRNTAEVGTLSLVEPGTIAIPPAPRAPAKGDRTKPLLKVTADAWVAFWSSHVATLIDESSDLPALRRLFLLYDKRERMGREVAESGMLTVGSTGQLVLHPLEKHLAVVGSEITALEDRFGLTPMARLKLGVTFGKAAKSLDAANARLERDDPDADEGEDDEDPRLGVIDTTAS